MVNVSPSLLLELLQRIARVTKDYLGVLNEESLRKNFILVYELLDEVIDFGYPQTTSTEVLKSYIFNEPIMVDAGRLPPLGPAAMFMQGTKRMPGTAVTRYVVATEPGGKKREEIFVDIIERISVTFSSSGYILTSEIDGTIQMKSYLTGNPEIHLPLNEDLSIGRTGSSYDLTGGFRLRRHTSISDLRRWRPGLESAAMDLALAAADQALATAYRRGDVDEEDPRRRQRIKASRQGRGWRIPASSEQRSWRIWRSSVGCRQRAPRSSEDEA